jgi:hypothetical protein
MALTITIPGAVSTTTGSTAPAVLTVGVGSPGAQGATGATGAGVPVAGNTGQVLTKQSGSNYDTIWTTIVPGDRYLTSSTTSNTISNGNKTFTIGTSLSYTPTQNLTISYDAGNHMHGEVLTYDSGTGVLTVDIKNHTGAGTYASWVVNVGGITPLASVAWGAITGTLSSQTDLQNSLDAKLSLAGGAMTGSITSSTATYDTEMAGDLFGVQLSADHTKGTTVEFDGLDTYDGANHMLVAPTGLTFPDATVQTTAFPGFAGYATESWVTAGFYPLEGNPASFASESWVNSQGYLTSAPVTSVAGRTGAITLAIADVSGAAPLASPSLTGVPLSTTAAANTNTTQIATTAFVVGQAGTGTPIVDGSAAVGTSLLYSRQDHVHPTDTSRAALASPALTGVPTAPTATALTSTTQLATTAFVTTAGNLKANLASPAFTGTPSLPTGTTGITQTAGNNTTALATTAFVTTAVPTFATNTEAKTGTSTTLAINPASMRSNDLNPRAWQLNRASFGTAVTGTGAVAQLGGMICYLDAGSISTGSALCRVQSNNDASFHLYATSTNGNATFSDKLFMSGRCGTYTVNDSAKTVMISFGKTLASGTGDLSIKGVGLKHVGGSSTPLILTVHNGTTLTNVNSSYTPVNLGAFDWEIYSDGAGNVTLKVDGSQVASTASGPTGACAAAQITYQEEIYFTATPALSYNNRLICARGKLIFGT